MRKQVLVIITIASTILLTAMMQDVLTQESLLDDSLDLSPQSESTQWSFNFNQGDKLTGVLSCTAGTLDLLIWLNDATAMHRQRAWEGQSVPFSWVIPSTGSWTVEVVIGQYSSCAGRIKLDVERATESGGLGLPLGPMGRIVLLGIIAFTAVAIVGVVGYALFQKLTKSRKPPKVQNLDPNSHSPILLARMCETADLFYGWR